MDNLNQIPILKKGGIHIKKKNRGKFTEYCGGKVTQECIAKGKKSKDPKIRKRATFAANARHWKHENGGILKAQNGVNMYPIYGSQQKAKLAYDAGSRNPEAIGALFDDYRPSQIIGKSYSHTSRTNDVENNNFQSYFKTTGNNNLGIEQKTGRVNGNETDVTTFLLPNGDTYSENHIDGTSQYNVDYAKRLGMDKLPKPKTLFEEGGILKAQGGTGNLLTPHPLSPVGIALNQAKAMAKMKGEQQHLPPGVKEVVGPDGNKVAIRTEQPLIPLEQSIAEWLPGTGDVAEVGYIADDVKNGNYGSAALTAAMVALPGNVGKILRKGDTPPVSKLTEAERLGIPKGQRSNPKALDNPQYWGYEQWNDRYNAAVKTGNWEEVQRLRDLHFITKASDTKIVDEFGMPKHMYHGRPVFKGYKVENPMFTRFKGVNRDVENAVEEGSLIDHWKLAKPVNDRMSNYHTPNYETAKTYVLGYTKKHLDGVMDNYLYIKNPANFNDIKRITGRSGIWDWADFTRGRKELMELGYDGLYIPQYHDAYGAFVSPSQFKSADPITWDGKGNIIPIVKRDNFRNLDTRYNNGGKL